MSDSVQDRLRRELEQLLKSLPEHQLEEAARAAGVLERLALALSASPQAERNSPAYQHRLTPSETELHHQSWVEFMSHLGVSWVPWLVPAREALLRFHSDLIVFVPASLREAAALDDAMKAFRLCVVTADRRPLNFSAVHPLCNHPGWTLIDRTLLGGPPISQEQKLLRMEPLENAPRHMPAMDLASFLVYCAFLRDAAQSLPRGAWTLAGSHWIDSRRSLLVECAEDDMIVMS